MHNTSYTVELGTVMETDEWHILADLSPMYEIDGISMDGMNKVTVNFLDEMQTTLEEKLGRIANLLNEANLDDFLVAITKKERWETGYVMPEVSDLILMDAKGTC